MSCNSSAPALAYLGDAVITLFARRFLLSLGIENPAVCSEESLLFVTATAQSAAYENIKDTLTQKEADVYRLGRNAKVTTPKSSTPIEYHRATGFEAIFGYLDAIGDTARANELFSLAYSGVMDSIRTRHAVSSETNEAL